MEKEVLKVLIAPGVGAFIGYFTNYLAIKMLFRPYRKYTLWKFSIPFTPGLIPKKREKLIEVIAKVVKEELFTKEIVLNRLEKLHIKKDLQVVLNPVFARLIENLENYIEAFLAANQNQRIKAIFPLSGFKDYVKREYNLFLTDLESKRWEDVLPVYLRESMEEFILAKIESITEEFVKSPLFKEKIKGLLKQKVSSFPFLGFVPKMEEKLISTISVKVEEFLKELKYSKELKQALLLRIREEWKKPIILSENLREGGIKFLSEKIEEVGEKKLREVDKKHLEFLVKGIKQVLIREKEKLIEHLSEDLVNVVKQEMPRVLESLDVEELVKERLNSLSLKELEELILKVSREELKHITFLGGVIGFIVGFFQWLLQLL